MQAFSVASLNCCNGLVARCGINVVGGGGTTSRHLLLDRLVHRRSHGGRGNLDLLPLRSGFLSEQGIIGQLGNASFSVVSNEDYEGSFVTLSVACRVITAAAKALKGQTLDLHCRS